MQFQNGCRPIWHILGRANVSFFFMLKEIKIQCLVVWISLNDSSRIRCQPLSIYFINVTLLSQLLRITRFYSITSYYHYFICLLVSVCHGLLTSLHLPTVTSSDWNSIQILFLNLTPWTSTNNRFLGAITT